ncbi:MAG: hypothetical protein HY812_11830 [Planctomycetes bacterium]|nr:hypothetical protein [Planctomycetota bacterium]
MRAGSILLLLAALFLLCACRARPAALASSTTPVEPGDYVILGEAQGSAWGVMLFVIPLHGRLTERARDAAIASYPSAHGLVNVSVDYNLFYLPLVTITRANVRGEAFQRNQ